MIVHPRAKCKREESRDAAPRSSIRSPDDHIGADSVRYAGHTSVKNRDRTPSCHAVWAIPGPSPRTAHRHFPGNHCTTGTGRRAAFATWLRASTEPQSQDNDTFRWANVQVTSEDGAERADNDVPLTTQPSTHGGVSRAPIPSYFQDRTLFGPQSGKPETRHSGLSRLSGLLGHEHGPPGYLWVDAAQCTRAKGNQ